jgi:hypothetical protein
VPIFFVPLKIAQRRLRLQGGSNFDNQGLDLSFYKPDKGKSIITYKAGTVK